MHRGQNKSMPTYTLLQQKCLVCLHNNKIGGKFRNQKLKKHKFGGDSKIAPVGEKSSLNYELMARFLWV